MSWTESLADIESLKFDVHLNALSGYRTFFKAVSEEPSVIDLRNELETSFSAGEDLLGRIYDLAHIYPDARYENPKDVPLAVYLWLLEMTKPSVAELAAHYVRQAPQCWYADQLAYRILNRPEVASENSWELGNFFLHTSAGDSSGFTIIPPSPSSIAANSGYHQVSSAQKYAA